MAGTDDYLINGGQPSSMPVSQVTAPTPDVSQPQAASQPQSFASQVKGPFGTHGVLGSVLGTLGDIVLANAGLQPVYQQKLQNAKMADAIQGWDSDPAGAYINMVRQFGFKSADEFINDRLKNNYVTAETGTANARTAATTQKATDDQKIAALKQQSPLMTMATQAKDPATAAYVGKYVRAAFARNPSWDAQSLPADDDPTSWQLWGKSGMNPYQSVTADEREAHNDALEEDADDRIAETERHNSVTEGQGAQRISMTGARDAASQSLGQARLAETVRHNGVTEKQGQAKIDAKSKPTVTVPPFDPAKYAGKSTPDPQGRGTWHSDGKSWTLRK